MADYVKMWAPDEGQTFIDGDYTYTVQANNTLSVKVTSTDKATYGQIKDDLIINGETYTTTSMDGCFEGCSSLTTAPIIPSGITSMQSCFKECTKLSGNIVALNSTISSYTDIFTNTDAARKIFIVHSTEFPDTSADIVIWRTIARNFSNVYYKAESNPSPTNTPTVERGTYDENEGKWKLDDTEDDIRVTITAKLFTNYLPEGWTNEITSYSVTFEGTSVTLVDAQINGATVTGYILNEENAGTIRTTVTDSYNNTSNEATAEVYNVFVMLDFYPGGEGMAIGKASERNGLDIAIPTTIGEGLDPPTVFKPTEDTEIVSGKTYYSDKDRIVEVTPTGSENPHAEGWYEDTKVIALKNYQFIVGEYNKKRNDSIFIVGGGKEEDGVETRSNLMEIGNNLITIGDSDEGHVEIDYHSLQLIDKEGDYYFYISDLRNTNGQFESSIKIIGDGETVSFNVGLKIESLISVIVDNQEVTSEVTYEGYFINFTTAPTQGSLVEISFITTDQGAKAYTLGTRVYENVIGASSVVLNRNNTASGPDSLASGYSTIASGNNAHSEGYITTASGECSHSEGKRTEATGSTSHAEGRSTKASGNFSHAEGNSGLEDGIAYRTEAKGDTSHAEGAGTFASGSCSHTEGFRTKAKQFTSHAEGCRTDAAGYASHAQNYGTIAAKPYQTALGIYNIEDTETDTAKQKAFIIGNGTAYDARSNALTVDWNGNMEIALDITATSGIDYEIYNALTELKWDSNCII